MPGDQDGVPERGRRHAGLVAAGIGLSRVSGLVRERAIGHFVGTSFAADAYAAAARLPNLLQHLLGEGTLSASFIPVYSRLLDEGREEDASRVAGAVLGLLAVAAGAIALVGVLLARPLTSVVAAGLVDDPATLDLTVDLVRILFPAMAVLVVSAWCLGVLNSHRRFFLSYVAPVAMNLVQVAVLVTVGTTVLTGASDDSARLADLMRWLAVGTVAGGALQLAVQLPTARRSARSLQPNLDVRQPDVEQVIRSSVPVIGARGVVQISRFVQLFLASFLAVGALATLRYAQALVALPISLFGMSVAAAELPELSSPSAAGSQPTRLDAGLARVAAFVVPSVVAFVVIGDLVAGAVLQSGNFRALDATAVWFVLAAAAVGLLPTASARLLQSSLYGASDPTWPARIAVVRVVVAAALGAALMVQFDRLLLTGGGVDVSGSLPAFEPVGNELVASDPNDSLRLGAVGLALGGSIAGWVEYFALRHRVVRNGLAVRLGGSELRPILSAAVVAGGAGLALRWMVDGWHPLPGGLLAVAGTGVVYVAVATRLHVDDITALVRSLRHR
ncbi:MAG: murein biosynthesis integral membrane protein MurJ [Ilumatobacter sp.]|nr:murein biosynthesis integral membrane protein MurJ [Ilumatobacter sp.]